ncbi:MAG: STT3 domain-containing protein [Candidatus Nanoarchaeia archaeon]
MAEDHSDDLEIDLSKFKKLFKRDAKDSGEKKESKDESEDLTVDLSGVGKSMKKFFTQEEKESEDLAVQVDWKKAQKFFTSPHVLTVILLLIPLFFSMHYRMYPADLPITEDYARGNIHNFMRSQIAQDVENNYPHVPADKKSQLVNERFQEQLDQRQGEVDQAIKQNAAQLRQRFQDDTGQTYLIAIDPYTYYREVRNMIENGHVGDEYREVDGKTVSWNTHTRPPVGNQVSSTLHHYVGYYWYKLWSIFNPNVSLLRTFFFIPVIISMLAVIPAFFIARKAGGNIAAFFASMLVAVHPQLLNRTAAGFSDTDAYNVMLPLYIAWFFLLAIDAKTDKERYGYAALSGLFVGLFAFAWSGWWYIMAFLIATIGALAAWYLTFSWIEGKSLVAYKNEALAIVTFLIVSVLSLGLFKDFKQILSIVQGPLGFLFIKQAAHENLWPNVYTTVAELNAANMTQIIAAIGGLLMVAIGVVGIGYLLYHAAKKGKSSPALALLLTIWFLGTMFAARSGVRFVLLMVPAYSLAVGIGVSAIHRVFSDMLSSMFHISKNYVKPVIFLLFLLLLITPFKAAAGAAKQEIPSMNDVWWRSLEHIKDNSQPDAVITSWWDFGHWFKAIADRAVTFDGGSQNTPQAHWAGRSLLTNNEDQAVGILRMLDCGANTAFDALQEENDGDTIESVETLYSIFELDAAEARIELEDKGLNADKILPLTHCDPPEGFFITSQDMVRKSGVWAHFGSWNFTRAKIVVETKKGSSAISEIEALGFSNQEANEFYSKLDGQADDFLNGWIAPWPSYNQWAPGVHVVGCRPVGDGVQCDNGGNSAFRLGVNLSNFDARLETGQGLIQPKRFVYWDGESEDLSVKEYNTTNSVSAALIPRGNSYQAILMHDDLAMGMFTRLFYLEGHGLRHFDKVFDQVTVNNWRVIVWKVDWDGTNRTIAYTPAPEVENATDSIPEESVDLVNITENVTESNDTE